MLAEDLEAHNQSSFCLGTQATGDKPALKIGRFLWRGILALWQEHFGKIVSSQLSDLIWSNWLVLKKQFKEAWGVTIAVVESRHMSFEGREGVWSVETWEIRTWRSSARTLEVWWFHCNVSERSFHWFSETLFRAASVLNLFVVPIINDRHGDITD